MARRTTVTGGRAATTGVIPGRWALSVGCPGTAPPTGFVWTCLADVARLESGHTPSRGDKEYWNGDIPWIGIRDATANHGRTIYGTRESITGAGVANSSARVLPPRTVCLSRTASVGYVVSMGVPMATSQDFVNWVCSQELNPKYLHYLLMAEQDSIRRFAHGTTHQTLYYPEAKALHVCIPSRGAQDGIVEVLGALDDKTECNTLIAGLLEERWTDELTQALNGWDVDDLLPSSWSRASLSSVARFVNGRNFTKDATGTGRMVIRIAELTSGPGRSTVYNEIDVPSDHVARPGDLLFAWSGSLTVQRWFRPEAIVNQHIFKVIPHSDIPTWLVHGYLLKLLPWYRQIAAGKATTMGHIQRHHLDEPVPLPDAATRNAFDERCAPLWHRALAAEQESLVLAQLRDTLLPRLLSGELRVRDAEAAVEEVA